ncbi:MAG: twin-arginine translocation signal domain-containing protein [Thermodesulfobacteriota bacterium]
MKNKKEETGISRRNFLKTSAALGVAATVTGIPNLSFGEKDKKTSPMKSRMKPGMVNSVLGPISPSKLGATFMHEHFAFAYPGWYADSTLAPYDFKAILKTNIEVIKTAQKNGIKTIVDATPNDTGGRDPELFKALAKKTGINIICSTGLYTDSEGAPAYFKSLRWGTDTSKMISEMMIAEITRGIGDSGVLAGVIKVGSSPKMTPHEEAVHKAAVIAQKATGVPIITHTEGPTGGIEQADFLKKQGADCTQLMIGHVSNSRDIEYHKAILSRGVYIAFDRIGLDIITPFDVNVKNVAELCKLGFADQIMLSHDTVNVWLGRMTPVPEKYQAGFKNWHIAHIHKDFLPALKAQGVSDEQIKIMMEENPKNLFMGN